MWGNTTVSMKRTSANRCNEDLWQAGRHTPNTGISSKANMLSDRRDGCTTLCVSNIQ